MTSHRFIDRLRAQAQKPTVTQGERKENENVQHNNASVNASSDTENIIIAGTSSSSDLDTQTLIPNRQQSNIRTPNHPNSESPAGWRGKGRGQSDNHQKTRTETIPRATGFPPDTPSSFPFLKSTSDFELPLRLQAPISPSKPNGNGETYRTSVPQPLRTIIDPDILEGLEEKPLWHLSLQLPSDNPDRGNNVISLEESRGSEGISHLEPRYVMPLSSYNWTEDDERTIIVPGCPPVWQGKPLPFTVKRDNGVSFIDSNRYRMPLYPLLPLFLSIDELLPQFDYSNIDIISDRNNLRKLLRWVNGTIHRDFRINLQLVGRTVLMERTEPSAVEANSERLGYGRNFEQVTTKQYVGCEKSISHHRMITYDYGELKLLIRFEVDACIFFDKATQDRDDTPSKNEDVKAASSEDDLLVALDKLTISPDHSKTEEINVIHAGVLVPQSSLVEMGTKAEKRIDLEGGIDWKEYFPQVFLSQTPHHYLALHQAGRFKKIQIHSLKAGVFLEQQEKQQQTFNNLYVLLKKIKELVLSEGEENSLTLVFQINTKEFKIYKRKTKTNLLPESWVQKLKGPRKVQ